MALAIWAVSSVLFSLILAWRAAEAAGGEVAEALPRNDPDTNS